MSKSTWIPQVGEWVVIQKSTSNWNSMMEEFDKRIVQILSVEKYHGIYHQIQFEYCGQWALV